LFVLFLSGSSAAGGWGWSEQDALLFNGWYMGALMMSPLLGGWLSIRYVSERSCIAWGAGLIMSGHVLFFASHYVPFLVERVTGLPVAEALASPGLVLGHMDGGADAARVILARNKSVIDTALENALLLSYRANAVLFYAAIMFLFLGTALIKPTVSSIVAGFYRPDDARRVEGFQLLFFGLYLGCMLGITVPGLLGERFGWHAGFSVAGIGMALGLAAYLGLQNRWLGSAGCFPPQRESAGQRPVLPHAPDRLKAYFVHGLFTVIYMAIFYQVIGILSLYIRDHVDRSFFGFDVPTTWVQNVSVVLFLAWTPCISLLTRRMARKGVHFSTAAKSACALLVLAGGFALLAAATDGSRPSLLWFAAAYALFGLGDALLGPAQVFLATRLAPQGRGALYVSGWFVFVGIGALLSGYIGAYSTAWLSLSALLASLAGVAACAALSYRLLFKRLAQWGGDVDAMPFFGDSPRD
jgi:POT family proton-dependent oligopeptide transporter